MVSELCPENRFDLVFDEKIDGPELIAIFKEKNNVIIEMNEDELSDDEVADETWSVYFQLIFRYRLNSTQTCHSHPERFLWNWL